MRICKDCGIEILKKTTKKGFFNQCNDCSEEDGTERHLGFNDGTLNKSVHTSIYRGGDPTTRKKIQNQKARVG